MNDITEKIITNIKPNVVLKPDMSVKGVTGYVTIGLFVSSVVELSKDNWKKSLIFGIAAGIGALCYLKKCK